MIELRTLFLNNETSIQHARNDPTFLQLNPINLFCCVFCTNTYELCTITIKINGTPKDDFLLIKKVDSI